MDALLLRHEGGVWQHELTLHGRGAQAKRRVPSQRSGALLPNKGRRFSISGASGKEKTGNTIVGLAQAVLIQEKGNAD